VKASQLEGGRRGPHTRPLRVGIVVDGVVGRRAGDARSDEVANGGVGVYVDRLLRALAERDDVAVVPIRPGPLDLELLRDPRFETVSDPLLRRIPRARWLDVRIAAIARRHALDLVHYPNQLGGAFLSRRIPRVATLHDLTPLSHPQHHPRATVLGYRALLRRSVQRADRVIVDSEAVRADLLRELPGFDRVTTVPLGVDPRFRPVAPSAELRRRLDLPERFLLSVGVLEPRKNHAAMVRALAALHAAGERVALVIVGRPGWRWVDPLVATGLAELRPWVRILRDLPTTDLVELYGAAAALVYPSFREGFGLPVLEAMACGCPVVASDRPAMPEVAGDAALYASPDAPDEIAARVLEILRDEAIRSSLVARGIDRAARFTWERTADSTVRVYAEVAGRSSSRGKDETTSSGPAAVPPASPASG
jgi:glycosyltransferase involved in cell wall biosynthesis